MFVFVVCKSFLVGCDADENWEINCNGIGFTKVAVNSWFRDSPV